MLNPWSNNKGAIAGGITSALLTGWISFGTQAAIATGSMHPHRLHMSIEGCSEFHPNVTEISNLNAEYDESDVFPLYKLSFLWINPIGILSVLIVGTIVSLITGVRDLRKIDPNLISPVIHRFLPDECFQSDEVTIECTTELFSLNFDESHLNSGRTNVSRNAY